MEITFYRKDCITPDEPTGADFEDLIRKLNSRGLLDWDGLKRFDQIQSVELVIIGGTARL